LGSVRSCDSRSFCCFRDNRPRTGLPRAPVYGTIVLIMGTIGRSTSLSDTLFSRNRQAVLRLLYGHPDETFYLRQVARLCGGGHGAVQRELKALSDAGIIRRIVRGKQVFFQANAECPVYEEIKALMVKTAGAADVLKAAMASLGPRIQIALVYGSMAQARQKANSDVDVLVVGHVTFREVVAAFAGAQSQLGREVNPTVYAPEEFRSKLASGHHFVTSVLRKEKVFLIGDDRGLERLAQKRLADGAQNQPPGNRRSPERRRARSR
jgi:uncharacterized protein